MRVLGPEVEVLGQPVGGGDVREILGRAEGLPVALEDPRRRVADRERVVRVQRVVGERRLERLVVLGERPLGHPAQGEEARHAFRVHDERAHAVGGRRVGLEVGHVGPAPLLPFQPISLRFGSHGLPAGSAEARL